LAAELAKAIKAEKDLGILIQKIVKLIVKTTFNAELDELRSYKSILRQVAVSATVVLVNLPNA